MAKKVTEQLEYYYLLGLNINITVVYQTTSKLLQSVVEATLHSTEICILCSLAHQIHW